MSSTIKPPADRDTLPDDVTLADVWRMLRAVAANVEMLVRQGQIENTKYAEIEARVRRVELQSLNGSEHPGPEAA